MERKRPLCTAILLAGGSGKRMGSHKPKQFLEVAGKPLIWYSLNALEKSKTVDNCILVVAEKDIPYVQEDILKTNKFTKVRAVTEGGRERFESVWKGLQCLKRTLKSGENISSEIILIHDGARPFLTEEVLERCCLNAEEYGACVAAVPSKDTITVSDKEGFERVTPNRKYVWNVQTPQAFRRDILFSAFDRLAEDLEKADSLEEMDWITDDASVVQHYTDVKIRLVQGDYRNIKVTTPEDLSVAEGFLTHDSINIQ